MGLDVELFKQLASTGVLGVFAVLLIIFARGLLAREQARSDAAAAEVTRLNTLMQEKFLPALISATQAISASQAILQEMQLKQQILAEARRATDHAKPS